MTTKILSGSGFATETEDAWFQIYESCSDRELTNLADEEYAALIDKAVPSNTRYLISFTSKGSSIGFEMRSSAIMPDELLRCARRTFIGNVKRMAIKRMDNVGIVVNDLKAAIAFFAELGMELVGETTVTGDWVDRVVGLNGVESEIAIMRTPDDHTRLELSKFKAPEVTTPDLKNEQINTLGKHRIMFAVDDIKDTIARLHTHGAELVGEIVQYKDMYLLCYLRGPEGIMLALAEEIGT